jgi:hypothetical protein
MVPNLKEIIIAEYISRSVCFNNKESGSKISPALSMAKIWVDRSQILVKLLSRTKEHNQRVK